MGLSAPRVGRAQMLSGALEGALVLGMVGLAVLKLPTFGIDFATYRAGSAALAHGLYEGPVQTGLGPMPFTYPPFAAALFTPMTWLSTWLGVRLWNAATLLCLWWVIGLAMAGSPHTWSSDAGRRLWRLAAFGLAIASGPMTDHLGWGQINVLIMALVLADVLGRISWLPKGVGVGLAAGIKLTPGLFIVFFLICRQWRAALVAGLAFAATMLLSAALQWDATWTFVTEVLRDLGSRVSLGDPWVIGNQSVLAMMTRAEAPAGLATAAVLVVAVVGLALAARAEPLPAACIIGLLSALVVPVGWSHHFVYLVPATVLLALAGRHWSVALALAIVVVGLARGPRLGSELVEKGLSGGTILESSLGLMAMVAIVGLVALPRQGPSAGSAVPGEQSVPRPSGSAVHGKQCPCVDVVHRAAHHEPTGEQREASDPLQVTP